jgi:hypothetical protein
MKTHKKLTLSFAFATLIFALSCGSTVDIGTPEPGSNIIESSFFPWNTIDTPAYFHLGDSMIFTMTYEGYSRLKTIDVSLEREKIGTNTSDVLLFESYYPTTNNVLIKVKWKLDESIGLSKDGFRDMVYITTVSGKYPKKTSFGSINIIEKTND